MRTRVPAGIAVATLLLLAGCSAPVSPADAGPADLEDERIGYVDGYWYDDELAVDGSAEVDEQHLDAVVARAMARIERERGVNFERRVPVEVVTRAEFREREVDFTGSVDAFDEEVYRANFLVGDDESVADAYEQLYGAAVAGFYDTRDGGRIVVVVDDPETVRLDRDTLVHELVHALQDQLRRLGRGTETRDELLAWQSLFEGEANYLMYRYAERCGDEWTCLAAPDDGDGEVAPPQRSFNEGLFVATYLPYSEGPAFVHRLRERGDWDAVDAAYDDPPESTVQVVDTDRYPDDPPRAVTVPDRSGDAWEPFEVETEDGEGVRSETLGPASLYAAFWYNEVIDRSHLVGTDDAYAAYNYSHPLIGGWDGDAVVPFRTEENETAHVFRSAWQTDADAAQFRDGYAALLEERGATAVDEGVYRIPDDDPFSGAYRVDRRGDRVTVVHAPTIEDLDAVHAERATATASLDTAGSAVATA